MSNEQYIDDIGAQVKALIHDMKRSEDMMDQTRKLAQPLLRQVWDALERGETVAQCKSKTEFAKYAGVSLRYCQFVLKDGNRKRSEKDANRVRSLAAYPDAIDFRKGKLTAYIGIDKLNVHDVSGDVTVYVECQTKDRVEYLPALGDKVKDTLRQLRLWTKEFAKQWKEAVASYMESLPQAKMHDRGMTDDNLNLYHYYLVHVGIEDGKPIIAQYIGAVGKKHQFKCRAVGTYNVRDTGKILRPANENELAEEMAWVARNCSVQGDLVNA